jgi:DNA-binding response OmpR family regulator
MVSANSDTKEIAQKSGADGFLLKPFDLDELLDVVTTHTA